MKRDFDQALSHYRESLRLEDRQWPAHYFIAHVYEEQTNFVAAIQEFEDGDKAVGRTNAERKVFYDALREAVGQDPVKGYWRKRLDLALQDPQSNPYYLATLYARLHKWDEAYTKLKEAVALQAFDQGLMFDLCWNHDDPRFIAIAKSIGLKE